MPSGPLVLLFHCFTDFLILELAISRKLHSIQEKCYIWILNSKQHIFSFLFLSVRVYQSKNFEYLAYYLCSSISISLIYENLLKFNLLTHTPLICWEFHIINLFDKRPISWTWNIEFMHETPIMTLVMAWSVKPYLNIHWEKQWGPGYLCIWVKSVSMGKILSPIMFSLTFQDLCVIIKLLYTIYSCKKIAWIISKMGDNKKI